MTGEISVDVYSAMQTGKPYKSYRKTILGKVSVEVWNEFDNKPEWVLLYGRPETAIVDVWTEKGEVYFKNKNKVLMDAGLVLEVNRADLPPVPEPKVYADTDLLELFKNKFFKFRSILNNIDSEALLLRILRLAEEHNYSAATTKAIEARLSEVQTADFNIPSLKSEPETK